MNKSNKIFGYAGMGAGLILILSVFLPYVSYFSMKQSLWKADDPAKIILIILGLFVIGVYLFNKETKMSYMTAGFGLFYAISMVVAAKGLEYFSIGFYLLFLSSLTIAVMTYLYDEKEEVSLIKLLMNKKTTTNKVVANPNMQQSITNNQPQQFTQQSMMNQQPMQQQVITGYDPNTGAPIYSNQNTH